MRSERDACPPRREDASVVVLTLNAEHHMPGLLAAIAALPRPPRRVLFIDSSSDDRTRALALEHGHECATIRREDFGHGRTRNDGLRRCDDSDFVVFLTQDACPLGRDWLDTLLAPFADPDVAVVYGRQRPRAGARWAERYAREFNYPTTPDRSERSDLATRGIRAVFCSNSFAAYRRTALESIGGFPERLPMGEDMAATLRLLECGHARVYHPQAEATHSHDYSLREELRRYFDIGALMAMDPALRRLRPQASGEGWRYLLGELGGTIGRGAPGEAVESLARTAAKSLGYALGRRHASLPASWRARLGMHSVFWSGR